MNSKITSRIGSQLRSRLRDFLHPREARMRREIDNLRDEIEELREQMTALQDIAGSDYSDLKPGMIRWRDEDGNTGVTEDIVHTFATELKEWRGWHVALAKNEGVVATGKTLDELLSRARCRQDYRELRIHYVHDDSDYYPVKGE